MNRTIIFNADDWGLSQQIHQAIVSLHGERAIDAAGIMMGQDFTDQAVDYARNHPDLRVGIHLFATDRDCKPLGRDRWPFAWPEDLFINAAMGLPYVQAIALEQIRLQLAAYRDTRLPLHFVNSHYHFHAHRDFVDQTITAIREYFPHFDGWMRFGDSKPFPGSAYATGDLLFDLIEKKTFQESWTGLHNKTLWGMSSTFKNDAAQVAHAARQLGHGLHEFFFHPGRGKSLSEGSADYTALLELTKLFPQSERNLSALP